MRPSEDEGKFTIATQMKDGRAQIVVNALDDDDRFLNFLELASVGVGPDMKPFPITMKQQAPGRYVGEFDADSAGSYMLTVSPGPGKAPLTTGFTVPFTDEYRVRPINLNLLEQYAALEPKGGAAGDIGIPLESTSLNDITLVDRFRSGLQKAFSLTDIWPWMLCMGCALFFSDILVRRLALEPYAITQLVGKYLRRSARPEDTERQKNLEMLRSRKAAVGDELAGQRATTRFEVSSDAKGDGVESELSSKAPASASTNKPVDVAPKLTAEEEKNYTSRLLAAKKAAQKNKKDSN
jgi:hypothetical protein